VEGSNVFGIQRFGRDPNRSLAAIFNFSDAPRTYWFHPEKDSTVLPVLHTDWERFGGRTKEKAETGLALARDGFRIELPPFASVLMQVETLAKKVKKEKKKAAAD
jgi:hypothetical protein